MSKAAGEMDVCIRATQEWPEYLVQDAARRVTEIIAKQHFPALRAHLVLIAATDEESVTYSARCGIDLDGVAVTAAAHGPTPPLALERLSKKLQERIHATQKGRLARLLAAASDIA